MIGYILKLKLRAIIYFFTICFILYVIYKFNKHDKITTNKDIILPVILWWTPFINNNDLRTISCDTSKCLVTENRKYLHKPETNVLLFYGSSFSPYDLPIPRKKSHKWAIIHEESPKNLALFIDPISQKLFNYTSTFSRFSNFPITLQYLPNISIITDIKYFRPIEEKNLLLNNLSPVLYIQSDCITPLERDSYVTQLMKYIPIDSYGKCLNNKILPKKLRDNPLNNLYSNEFINFVAQYKFIIAFENSICDDYITEKLWRPLIAGSIPIYMGSPSTRDWLPNKQSAIIASDFNTPKDLAEYILKVNSNDSLYNSYIQHKIKRKIENKLLINTLHNRQWIIDDENTDGKHFFEVFECFICENINKNLKIEENNIYNCPEPISPINKQKNESNWWINHWREGKCQAQVLNKIVANQTISNFTREMFDNETFKLMNENLC